jgi:GNAT superfamily N-acetyltransferase
LTIYNTALADNWGFAPMSFHELRSMAELFQYVLDSSLIRAAEVEENGVRKVVGAVISVPDLNEILRHTSGRLVHPLTIWKLLRMKLGQPTERIRVVFLGVLPEYRHTPVSALLLFDTIRMAKKFGAREIEGSWILEDNPAMYKPLEDHGFQITDRYVIYERPIT